MLERPCHLPAEAQRATTVNSAALSGLLRARSEHRPFHAEVAEIELLQHLERLLAEAFFCA